MARGDTTPSDPQTEADALQTLRACGLVGDDATLLRLLKAADMHVERALNHYFDAGAPKFQPPPPQQQGKKELVTLIDLEADGSKDGTVVLQGKQGTQEEEEEEEEDEEDDEKKPAAPAAAAGASQSQCTHDLGPNCFACALQLVPARAHPPPPQPPHHEAAARLFGLQEELRKGPGFPLPTTWPKILGQRIVEDSYIITRDRTVYVGK